MCKANRNGVTHTPMVTGILGSYVNNHWSFQTFPLFFFSWKTLKNYTNHHSAKYINIKSYARLLSVTKRYYLLR